MKPSQSKKFLKLNSQVQDQKVFRLVIFSVALLGSFVLFGTEKAFAATNNFTADGGEWNTAGNWSLGHVPDGTEDTTFTGIVTPGVTLTTGTLGGSAKSIDFSTAGATFTLAGSTENIAVLGNLTLKTGMTVTFNRNFLFRDATCVLTTNGVSLSSTGVISFMSGGISLADDLTANYVLVYNGGSLTTNNHNISCGIFGDNNAGGNVTLNLGSSNINCTNVSFSYGGSALTVNTNTATINLNSTSSISANFGGVNWNGTIFNVTLSPPTSAINAYLYNQNSNFRCKQFNVALASDRRDTTIFLNSTITVDESSTWKGGGAGYDDPTIRPLFQSSITGTQRTIQASTSGVMLTFTDVDFMDVAVSSTNSPSVTGTRVGDCGGNSNVDTDAPKTVYLDAGTSSSIYLYSNYWSLSSGGGSPSLENFPLPQDTAVIDDNSWDVTGRLFLAFSGASGSRLPNIDASGLTESNEIRLYAGTYYGDINLSGSGVIATIYSGHNPILDARVKSEASDTLDINIPDFITGTGGMNVTSYNGSVKLINSFSIEGVFTLTQGTLDLNSKTLTAGTFSSSNSNVRTLQDSAGGGKIVVNGLTGTVFDVSTATNLTVSNAPDIDIGDSNNTLTGDITFAGGGKTFGDFKVTKHAGNYDTLITGSNTFGSFTLETPDASYNYSDLQFTAGTTTTVTSFTATGTASYPININSSTNAAHTLSDTTGTNTAAYCNLTNSTATGGATWDASNESTNGGNNTGWIIENSPTTEFVAVVDPGNGTGTDYTSLAVWENSFGTIDLNSTNTKVFSGTATGTLSDSVTVYQCRSGVYQNVSATMVHDTATQALVKNITAWASFSANDVWYTNNTCNSANYYTISNTGDSPIVVAKCRATNGTADTSAVNVSGWTTSATNYIKIWTDPSENYRHQGKWDDTKYRLDTAGYIKLYITANYVRIDGLQIKDNYTEANNSASLATNITGNSAIYISNNILWGNATQPVGYWGILLTGHTGSTNYVWNNIIYGYNFNGYGTGIFIGGWNTTNEASYVYNNTIHGCINGIYTEDNNSEVTVKNNLSYNNSTADYVANPYFNANSTHNLSKDNTAPAIGTYYRNATVTFRDETNDDFHLAQSDTGAKNQGILLYDSGDDPNLYFTTAIDGNARLDSAGTWDIGADEVATLIYRSVGPEVTQVLATGASNPLNISGSTVSFNTGLPDNIGVGDVLEYDDDNDGDIDASDSIAFIHGRTDPTHFTLKTATGGNPTLPSAADEIHWNLNRAYTRLAYWEAGTENTLIDSDLRGFDSGNRDIAANNEQWNVACYANGTTADPGGTYIQDWTTHRTNYIKIYTPYLDSEVGEPQRHQGVWTEGKYHLVPLNTMPIYNYISNVRIEGLQAGLNTSSSYYWGILNNGGSNNVISNSIIREFSLSKLNYGIYINENSIATGNKVFNNIVYDFGYGGIYVHMSTGQSYLYNNTVINCQYGIWNGTWGTTSPVVKNNIVQNSSSDGYYDIANGSDYNISDQANDAPSPSYRTNLATDVAFRDETNDDFHLSQFDAYAREYGTDLSSDPYLPFTDDIDGNTRHINQYWDIGADEEGGMIKAQFKGQHMFKGEVIFK